MAIDPNHWDKLMDEKALLSLLADALAELNHARIFIVAEFRGIQIFKDGPLNTKVGVDLLEEFADWLGLKNARSYARKLSEEKRKIFKRATY